MYDLHLKKTNDMKNNFSVSVVREDIRRILKNYINESKMSEIDIDLYKNSQLKNNNQEWIELLDRYPEKFQREIIDELPEGTSDQINLIKSWSLLPEHPIDVNLLDLLKNQSVKDAIGRTPKDVMNTLKKNPRYSSELNDLLHVSDTEVGREYGLKSGEIFDENPQRYFEYSTFDPKTAEPSTIVDGELWWGTGRLIAALLRGDQSIKVWNVITNEKYSPSL